MWGGEAGCLHDFTAWSSEASVLALKARASMTVQQQRDAPALADPKLDAKTLALGKESRRKSLKSKKTSEASCEVSATSRNTHPSIQVNVPIPVNDASQVIPHKRQRNRRESDSQTLAGFDSEVGQAINKPKTPNTPTIGDCSSLSSFQSQFGFGSDEPTDKYGTASIETDKADRPSFPDVSVGSHQSEEVSHIVCPSAQSVESDVKSIKSGTNAPVIPTPCPAKVSLGHSQMPSGTIDNLSATETGKFSSSPPIRAGQAPVVAHTVMICEKCGAVKCELGLEPTPELYVQHLVQVVQEVRRVLRKDGTLWLNMGCPCSLL